MRKISEMYMRSGGTNYQCRCRDCVWLITQGREYRCQKHGEDVPRKEDYIACKFCRGMDTTGQLKLEDFMA